MSTPSLLSSVTPIVNTSFERVTELYQTHVLPRLNSRQGRVTAISTAVAVTVVYLAYDKLTKPPRKLRHIPQVSFYNFVEAVTKRIPFLIYTKKNVIPLLEENESGVYLVCVKKKKIFVYFHVNMQKAFSNWLAYFEISVLIVWDGLCSSLTPRLQSLCYSSKV